jgi:hypothetical protein
MYFNIHLGTSSVQAWTSKSFLWSNQSSSPPIWNSLRLRRFLWWLYQCYSQRSSEHLHQFKMRVSQQTSTNRSIYNPRTLVNIQSFQQHKNILQVFRIEWIWTLSQQLSRRGGPIVSLFKCNWTFGPLSSSLNVFGLWTYLSE